MMVSPMKTLALMSRWYLTTAVIYVSNRAKTVHFGYKLWVLASATGVPYKIETYQERTNQGSDDPLDMLSKIL